MTESGVQTTYDRLLERIMSGAYPPATRLVNRSVAEDLGVSVVPVREALGRLASEGLVEHIPGAGSFVRSLGNRELAKLYALREHLETFAVVEAARSAQEYHILAMERCCDQAQDVLHRMEAARAPETRRESVEAWVESDAAFHCALIESADNPWLGMAVDRLRLLVHVVRTKPRDLEMSVYQNALREHVAITKAIEARDAAKAETLMRKHIQRAMSALLSGGREKG